MGRTKRTTGATKEMLATAAMWKQFRADNLLSQKFLAEIIGVVRRTVQHIENARVIPQEGTLKKFAELQAKYEKEGKSTGKSKRKHVSMQEQGEF
jgi:DNA-binding XRE family transcriptional regulator